MIVVDDDGLAALDAEDFRAWLADMPATSVCGTPRVPCDCPLARYLTDRRGEAHEVRVSSSDTWAGRFVSLVDRRVVGRTLVHEARYLLDAALADKEEWP